LALHWQPSDADPLTEFAPEREAVRAPRTYVWQQSVADHTPPPAARRDDVVDIVLFVVGAVLSGAALFLVFATAR
jgi:hypothetical protein